MSYSIRPAILAACAAIVGSGVTPAQDAPRPKFGKVFKREVDGLINALCSGIRADGSFLDGTATTTAKVLVAMGNSHRFYTLGDGPVVRRPVTFLFTRRGKDGSFTDPGQDPVETTQWVASALEFMDPTEYATEITESRRWLRSQGVRSAGPWETIGLELATRMRQDGTDPKSSGKPVAAKFARGPIRGADGSIDAKATIDGLLHLVTCQVLARQMDRGDDGGSRTFPNIAQNGFDYLLTQQKDGIFLVQTPGGPIPDHGLTGLGLAALQTKPIALRTPAEQKVIDAGLAALVAKQNDDGSFGLHTINYATCAAILALTMAEDPRFAAPIAKARDFVLALQNAEDRGYARADRDYGSIGYGGDQRGDLSNLGFAVDALRRAGVDEKHEALQKALVFLQRTQNLKQVNDFEGRRVKDEHGEWQVVRSGDDGGAAYYPGNSPAGYDAQSDGSQVPRSYGSMTYMLLRTYTMCGVEPDDPRMRRAIDWISKNWTLDENPGSNPLMPEKTKYQGLYYYYMVLAQALDAAGIDPFVVTSPSGQSTTLDWRSELRKAIRKRQQSDGSWLNEQNGRWWESQKSVCTIYAMLALAHCSK